MRTAEPATHPACSQALRDPRTYALHSFYLFSAAPEYQRQAYARLGDKRRNCPTSSHMQTDPHQIPVHDHKYQSISPFPFDNRLVPLIPILIPTPNTNGPTAPLPRAYPPKTGVARLPRLRPDIVPRAEASPP